MVNRVCNKIAKEGLKTCMKKKRGSLEPETNGGGGGGRELGFVLRRKSKKSGENGFCIRSFAKVHKLTNQVVENTVLPGLHPLEKKCENSVKKGEGGERKVPYTTKKAPKKGLSWGPRNLKRPTTDAGAKKTYEKSDSDQELGCTANKRI